MSIKILKCPYPYKAILSFTNDIDSLSWQKFIELHKYFNSNQLTKYGKGINIEVGNSFWFFQHPKSNEYAFSYYDNLTDNKSKYSEYIKELIKSRYIDSLHTWGNFSKTGGFIRRYAEIAVEESIKYSFNIPIWINHGDKYNQQNILHGQGDLTSTNFYSTDLLKYLNIQFLWTGELTKYIGQERSLNIKEVYFNNKMYFINNLYLYPKLLLKLLIKHHIFEKDSNSLIIQKRLRDNSIYFDFKRYGFWKKATFSDIPFLLSREILDELIRNNGVMSLYVHFGKNFPKSFSSEIHSTFEHLSYLYHNQDLLICTSSRLLKFILLKKYIKYKTENILNNTIIKISLPGLPSYFNNNIELDGLSFLVKKPGDYTIIHNKKSYNFKLSYDDSINHWILYKPWEKLPE